MKNKKCELYITISDEEDIIVNKSRFSDNGYSINLSVKPSTRLDKLLRKDNLLKMLREFIDFGILDLEDFQNNILYIRELIDSNLDILKNSKYISIDYDDNIREFLENNPILKFKKIHIGNTFDINRETYDELSRMFKGYDNIFIYTTGNKLPISMNDYKTTILAIEKILNKIKKYNLSPIEQVMYAYDLIRENIYTREEENENKSISRDLTSVIKGNKIVCVGYANIFEVILDNLGIKNKKFYMIRKDNPRVGHVRNMAYINDPKYEINGVYHFDATWDSKKNLSDDDYLAKYNFFCKTKKDMDFYTDEYYLDTTLRGFDENFVWNLEYIISEKGIQGISQKMMSIINTLSIFLDEKLLIKPYLIEDVESSDIFDKLEEYTELFFYNELSSEKLLEIIYNVRKIEYFEDPKKYPFEVEKFRHYMPYITSSTPEERLLVALTNKKISLSSEEFTKMAQRLDLDRKISQVKLVKTLKLILENKKIK